MEGLENTSPAGGPHGCRLSLPCCLPYETISSQRERALSDLAMSVTTIRTIMALLLTYYQPCAMLVLYIYCTHFTCVTYDLYSAR